MRVDARNYEQMRAWLAVMAPALFPESSPETDAIKCLDEIAAASPANARKGLTMAINDSVEMTAYWPAESVEALDNRLRDQGLPTLSDVRVTFSRDIRRVVRRGHIASEVEYFAVRNAEEMAGNDSERLRQLLEAYERQQVQE